MGSGAGGSSPDRCGPTLQVRLFGGFDVRLEDRPLPPLGSARVQGLLAYLLLHRDAPQPRQRLAFLLWPESTEPQARTNLRHLLHTLRGALPDADRFLDVRPRTVQWHPAAPLWLDVAEFEQAVADDRLEDAVGAYTGELLPGAYDDWLLEERDRLAREHLDALDRLVRRLADEGRTGDAIRHGERLIRLDPLREEAYRILIHLCDAAGDRARALRIYHQCATTLQRELGVEPSAATRAAYDRLLRMPSVPDTPDRRAAPEAASPAYGSGSPVRPPLVGRADERARLAALWRAADRGNARIVLVTGEPGIGKTRLVEELRSWCAQAGATTAEARAYPAEGAMAYGVVTTWLRADPVRRRLHRLDDVHLTELSRLIPELLIEVADLTPPERLLESEQRQRLFGAIHAAISAAGPALLLVVDDLHWCDIESLQFLHYLLRVAPDARMLVAATARREEVDSRHPMQHLVAALHALGCLTEMTLARLTRDETALLAERITGRPLPEADEDRLYADSEGNPLFVMEALRAGGGTSGRERGESPRVQAVITARLATLSDAATALVGVAATIGRDFTHDILAEASGVEEHALVRGLDELWRRGVVRAQGPNAYDFSHGKIREVAYLALSPVERRHHHLQVAEALARSHAGDADAVSGQIAAHYERAGATRRAVGWYQRAAGAAQRLHANTDAVRFLERALTLAGSLPAGSERDDLELALLTALPAPLIAVEGYLSERVAAVHERALAVAAARGVEPDAPLLRSLAMALLTRGEFDAARPVGDRLRVLADRQDDDVLRVESAYVLGVAAFWQGELQTAREHFADAVEGARPEHRLTHLLRYGQDPSVFCGLRLAYTLWLLGDDDEAGRRRDVAMAQARASGHPYTHVSTTAWAALLALDQHDEERLRRHMHELDALLTRDAARQVRLFAEALHGHADVLDGRARDGIRRVMRAMDDARAGEPAAPGLLAAHLRILVETCTAAADARTGLSVADQALEAGGGTQLWEAEIRRLRAGFLAGLGAPPPTVQAELRRAGEIARRQGAGTYQGRVRDSSQQLRAGTG